MATKFSPDKCDIGCDINTTDISTMQKPDKTEYFKRRFYDLSTGKPLQFDEVERRLVINLGKIEKLSVEAMLDLYFIHRNWEGFYNRKNNFRKWVSETLNSSLSYTYDIIKAIDLLLAYEEESVITDSLPERLAEPIERIGIKRLKLLAQVKDQTVKRDMLSDMIEGKDYSPDYILSQNRKAEVVSIEKTISNQNAEENQVLSVITEDRWLKLIRGDYELLICQFSDKIGLDHHLVKHMKEELVRYAKEKKVI